MDELAVAEEGLRGAGLLRTEDDRLVPSQRLYEACKLAEPAPVELLLGLVLEASPPLWLMTAATDGGHLAAELVPDDVASAVATVIKDPARREEFLLGRARTVDANLRGELGEEGEEAVVSACKEQLLALGAGDAADGVCRVSLVSDELGYDVIAPKVDGSVRRLEAKATRSAAMAVTVVVTRNEIEAGRGDPNWHLVVARVGRGEEDSILGHTSVAALEALLPTDGHEAGRWQAAQLRLQVDDLSPGLPAAE
ncbi:MAG TPA: DUF3883 domain-containing protein [Solirubrobacterales bacterium]|jgi:hypothetical protein|nr:DUF3883 domain-containing protein [Solirubrobacterales bacterium]